MTQQQPIKARPIILHAWEVCGLLDGTVTQLWRAMKRQPPAGYCRLAPESGMAYRGKIMARLENDQEPLGMHTVYCPYGGPGALLYVREGWALIDDHEDRVCVGYVAGPGSDYAREWLTIGHDRVEAARKFYGSPRHSAVRMPRHFSRITLEVKRVDALPVQEVTEEDKRACGLLWEERYGPAAFADFWDRDNPRHPYASNPMAWRLVVRRITT